MNSLFCRTAAHCDGASEGGRGAGGSFISSVGKRWTQLYPKRGDRGESGKREAPEHQGWKGKSAKFLPIPLGKAFPKHGWGTEALWDEGTRFLPILVQVPMDFGADGATRRVLVGLGL